MTSRTVAAHLDETTITRLRAAASVENRSPSQIQAVALKLLLDMSPGARRALFAIDGIADDAERKLAAQRLGRAALAAYEQIIDTRARRGRHQLDEDAAVTEEAIEAEAVRLCRS
jgi:cytochrome P450